MSTQNWDPNEAERELLRARFTLWLNSLLARNSARRRRGMDDEVPDDMEIVSMDAFPDDYFPDTTNPYEIVERNPRDFDFDEERIARAFADLPVMRKEVLRLLFVEQRMPKEIAERLHCSVQFVSVQKQRALAKLRKVLSEGDDV